MRFAARFQARSSHFFLQMVCMRPQNESKKITAATAQIATNASLVALRVSMYLSRCRFRRLWSSVFDFEIPVRIEREKRIHCVSKQKRLQTDDECKERLLLLIRRIIEANTNLDFPKTTRRPVRLLCRSREVRGSTFAVSRPYECKEWRMGSKTLQSFSTPLPPWKRH